MDISDKHIAFKKKIGKVKNNPVFHLKTSGGLSLILMTKNGKVETLGSGSHVAVARFIAEQHEPDIEWTELSKSEELDIKAFASVIPEYEALTGRIRDLESK